MKEYIWVFKTTIKTREDVVNVSPLFNRKDVSQWSVDTDDCDAVLRVLTSIDSPSEFILSITNKGYECSELTD